VTDQSKYPSLTGAVAMKTAISNLFAKISAFFATLQLRQILAVAIAGILLVTSVACTPSSPVASGTGSYRERVGQPANEKTYQRDRMASSSDYETGQNSKAAQAKAKALVDRAKQNVNQVDDLDDLIDEVKSGTANPARDAGDIITDATDRASRDAKAGFRNLQKNLGRAGDSVQDAAQDAKQNAAKASKNVRRGAEDVADYAKDKTQDTTDAIRTRS
jgi:maltose-binding protein MalE